MKYILIFFCFVSTASGAQSILLTDSTQVIISKTVSVDDLLSIPEMWVAIEGFPKKTFAITDLHYTITLKGSVILKGSMEDYMGIHGMSYPFKSIFDLKILKAKPGMILRIDRIHVVRKPGATGDISPMPVLEFILI